MEGAWAKKGPRPKNRIRFHTHKKETKGEW